MKFFSLFTLALTAFITLSAQRCGTTDAGAGVYAEAMPNSLWGVWVHSHEEDYGGNEVYRNPDFNFPPSRGRAKFDIKKDGDLLYYGLAPNDAHGGSVEGKWRAINERTLEVFFPNNEMQPFGLELVEITPERLVVNRLTD